MMKTRTLGFWLALGCAALSAPGAAQTEAPTGSRIRQPAPATPAGEADLSDEARALRTTFDYIRCVVQRDEKLFRPLLSHEPKQLTRQQDRALKRPACLRDAGLKMPMQIVRGALFRTFYLKDFGPHPIAAFGEPTDYFQGVDRQYPTNVFIASMLDFASCVVRADQANTIALVSAVPGEPEFEGALQALIPQLSPCMHPGLEVPFSRSSLVSFLSEALYWEAKAAAEAGVQTASD